MPNGANEAVLTGEVETRCSSVLRAGEVHVALVDVRDRFTRALGRATAWRPLLGLLAVLTIAGSPRSQALSVSG
jgi:hypothetical protein